MNVYIYVINVYIYVYAHTYIYIYLMCIYIYVINVYIYTYIHTYIRRREIGNIALLIYKLIRTLALLVMAKNVKCDA